MSRARSVVLLIALLQTAYAQILLNPPKDPNTIRVDVNLVNVVCTVRDKQGAYVKDLTKEDFEIREDGRLQPISHFARELDSPLTVALLIDVSGSVTNIISIEKEAAARFFSDVVRPVDQAMLVGFGPQIAVWQDMTSSVAYLKTALERVTPFPAMPAGALEARPRGGTLLYDAVNLVAGNKLKKLPGRKTMILITDGEDVGSVVNLETATRTAQEADAVVYSIHYRDENTYHGSGLKALERLSEQTGGRAFHVSKQNPLELIFGAIREEMRSQYGLAYNPRTTDGHYHRLEVKTSKSGLRVQARAGYYAIKR